MRRRDVRRPRSVVAAVAIASLALSAGVAGAVSHVTAARSATAPAKLILTVPSTAQVGHSVVAVVEAVDKQGFAVPTYRGKVTFTSTDPHAKVPKSYTFTAHDAGRHKFAITFKRLGGNLLKVRDNAKRPLGAKRSVTGRPRGTKTSVSCPKLVISTAKATCTATVTDNAHHGAVRPAGKVTFVLDPGQPFQSKASSCTLPARGTARCHVVLSSQFTGNHPVAASFAPARSDKKQAGSTGSFTFLDCFYRWYVDANSGHDSGTGDCNHPFATLNKAASVAKSGDTIRLAPDADYPLGADPVVVPAGVSITGQFTRIEGKFPASIEGNLSLSNGNTSLDRLAILGSISTSGADNAINDVEFRPGASASVCIAVTDGSLTFTDSFMHGACTVGVDISGATTTVTMSGDTITGGDTGVSIGMGSDAELDGSVAPNTFGCSTNADIDTNEGSPLSHLQAPNDLWDHSPPTVSSTASAGVDILKETGGTPNTAGSTVSANPCV